MIYTDQGFTASMTSGQIHLDVTPAADVVLVAQAL